MVLKTTADPVSLELKIVERYLVVKSEEIECFINLGDISLPSEDAGGVNVVKTGRAVLKLFYQTLRCRDEGRTSPQKKRRLLTLGDVVKILEASPMTVRRLELRGVLKPVRTSGGHRRYRPSDVERVRDSSP
jgi:hypothetical protein